MLNDSMISIFGKLEKSYKLCCNFHSTLGLTLEYMKYNKNSQLYCTMRPLIC